jgi:hypothetical protein
VAIDAVERLEAAPLNIVPTIRDAVAALVARRQDVKAPRGEQTAVLVGAACGGRSGAVQVDDEAALGRDTRVEQRELRVVDGGRRGVCVRRSKREAVELRHPTVDVGAARPGVGASIRAGVRCGRCVHHRHVGQRRGIGQRRSIGLGHVERWDVRCSDVGQRGVGYRAVGHGGAVCDDRCIVGDERR